MRQGTPGCVVRRRASIRKLTRDVEVLTPWRYRRSMQRGDEHAAPSGPALKKIDITIARLRLLLADVSARERGIEDQRRVFREQQNKLVTFSMYGESSLDSVLAMLGDVQERLSHIEA